MLLGTYWEKKSLLGNILAGKGMNIAEEGFIKAGYGSLIKNKHF